MLYNITPDQQSKVPLYLKKWLDHGYRTSNVDKEKATKAVYFLYEKILKIDKPKCLIHLDSPMACQMAANLIKNTKLDSSQLNSQLRSQLNSQLDSQLNSQLRSQLYSQLYSQLNSQLRSQLRSQLDSQLRSQLDSNKLEYFNYPVTLWWWSGWTGYYDFVLHELFPEKINDFKLYKEFLGHWPELHYYLAFKEIVFISDFPEEINLDSSTRLHAERKYALKYRDGYGFGSFNGIIMPDSIALKAANEIDTKEVLALTNTEQRHAAMKYIGYASFLKELGAKKIDESSNGELYYLTVENQKIGPYLFITCPSTGRQFLEGVGDASKYEFIDPKIKTVYDAHKWRAMRASKNLMSKFNKKWSIHA